MHLQNNLSCPQWSLLASATLQDYTRYSPGAVHRYNDLRCPQRPPLMSVDYSLMWLRHLKFSFDGPWNDLGLLLGCGCLLWPMASSSWLSASLSARSASEPRSLTYLIIRFIGQEYASSDSWSTPHGDSGHLAADPPLPECELGYSRNPSTSALPPAGKASPTVLVTAFHYFNLPPFKKPVMQKD